MYIEMLNNKKLKKTLMQHHFIIINIKEFFIRAEKELATVFYFRKF